MSHAKITILPLFTYLFILLFISAIFIGWVSNIISLFNLDTFSGELVIRVVGIFLAPLGAVLGFF
jgi:hypothetical protein